MSPLTSDKQEKRKKRFNYSDLQLSGTALPNFRRSLLWIVTRERRASVSPDCVCLLTSVRSMGHAVRFVPIREHLLSAEQFVPAISTRNECFLRLILANFSSSFILSLTFPVSFVSLFFLLVLLFPVQNVLLCPRVLPTFSFSSLSRYSQILLSWFLLFASCHYFPLPPSR